MLRKISLLLIPILLLSGAMLTRADSGEVFNIVLTGASLRQCGGNIIEAQYTAIALDRKESVVQSYNANQYFLTSNGWLPAIPMATTSGATRVFYLEAGSSLMQYTEVYLVSITNPLVRSNTLRIHCNGFVENLGGAFDGDGKPAKDSRLNYETGDLVNVLYPAFDSRGRRAIDVYRVNEENRGIYAGRFTYDMFQPYFNNPPEENTLIAEIDRSQLYAITSGQFQIVIHDSREVKIYSILFNAFPVSNIIFDWYTPR